MKFILIIIISSAVLSSIKFNENPGAAAKAGWYSDQKGVLHFIGKEKSSDTWQANCPAPSSLICMEKLDDQGNIILEIQGGPYQP